jgi:predicted site-specific integrase-resolvase
MVEHKVHATRCGFRSLKTVLERQGRCVEVVHLPDTAREEVVADLVADLVASVSSCCARL